MFSIVPEELLQSKTQQALHAMHAPHRKASEQVKEHLQRLQDLPHFAGAQHHSASRSGSGCCCGIAGTRVSILLEQAPSIMLVA